MGASTMLNINPIWVCPTVHLSAKPGCACYPWSALVPQYPHISSLIVVLVLGAIDIALVATGLYRFQRKAVS